ncbi:TPA: hypothetical protein L4559_003424 [Pseudomonas aeruginosa]|nr:hypothetical protein [Pseudomonas aeruginosa]
MTTQAHKPETPTSSAPTQPKPFSNVNDWFLAQEPGRQDVLREDKWMLASAAFDAGLRSGAAGNGVTVIGFRCRPTGSSSETEWTHVYHRAPDSFEIRECEIQSISVPTPAEQPQGAPIAHIDSSTDSGVTLTSAGRDRISEIDDAPLYLSAATPVQHAPVPKNYEARLDFLVAVLEAGLKKWENNQDDDRDQLLVLADTVAPLFTSFATDSTHAVALQAALGIVDKLIHTANQPSRDDLQNARTKIESSLLALYGTTALRSGDDSSTLARICDQLGIGTAARAPSVILTNISNLKRFSDLLDAVEHEFFMVPGEPSDEPEDEGCEPEDVCLLNRWGSTREQYVEQFRKALPRLLLEMDVLQPPAAYEHVLDMGEGQQCTSLTPHNDNPFGKPGIDYDSAFSVTSEPLFRAHKALASRSDNV